MLVLVMAPRLSRGKALRAGRFGEVLKCESAKVLKLGEIVVLAMPLVVTLLVMSLVTGQGTPGRQDFRRLVGLKLAMLVTLLDFVTGQGTPGRQDFRRLMSVEALGMERMGRRGQMGLRERTGTERTLMKARADQPPPEPDNPIPATAANGAGLPEGAAIATRQTFAAGSDRAYRFFSARHTSRRLPAGAVSTPVRGRCGRAIAGGNTAKTKSALPACATLLLGFALLGG